jgi:hypothetical protein
MSADPSHVFTHRMLVLMGRLVAGGSTGGTSGSSSQRRIGSSPSARRKECPSSKSLCGPREPPGSR